MPSEDQPNDEELVDAYDGIRWYRVPMRLVRLAWQSGHHITIKPVEDDK